MWQLKGKVQFLSNLSWLGSIDEYQVLMPLWPESDFEFNRKDIEIFLIYPTVIITPQCNKRFRSYNFLNLTGGWDSGLIRFERSENFKLLSLVQVQSQKTCNTKLVANFLHYPFVTRMLKSDKQGRSYDHWNTVHKWKNLEHRFWFGLMTISQNSAD
jgi:hypothetical protein